MSDAQSTLIIVSLAKLTGKFGTEEQAAERARLVRAAETVGFFYLKDHGMTQELVDAAFAQTKEFFDLPLDIKMRHTADTAKVVPGPSRAYLPDKTEMFHPGQGADHKQVLDFGFERPLTGQPFVGPNNFPGAEILPNFWSTMSEVQDEGKRIYFSLLAAFSLELFGSENHMRDTWSADPILSHRITTYPPYDPADPSGCGIHTDHGFLTLLVRQSGDTSLRLLPRGSEKWVEAPQIDDCITVNICDMFQMVTNKRVMSTPHQVQHNANYTRYSMPLFWYPSWTAQITPEKTAGDIMTHQWAGIWEDGRGAGRAMELAVEERIHPTDAVESEEIQVVA